MTLYTIGYGGRSGPEFVSLIRHHGIRQICDVRLRPDRSALGIFTLSKNPDKGILKLLSGVCQYQSVVSLGNVFLDDPAWGSKYRQLLDQSGTLPAEPVIAAKHPLALQCAGKSHVDCHRSLTADFPARQRDWQFVHIP